MSFHSLNITTSCVQEVDMLTYVRQVCGVVGIPLADNPLESLHLLFTVFLEFKLRAVLAEPGSPV